MQEEDFTFIERRRLGVIFNEVKYHARVSEEERKEKRSIVMDVLDELTIGMRQDPLFEEMFLEFRYTGSYFDHLRIVDANEFDINVVLKLPVRRDSIKLESRTDCSNFANLRLDYRKGDPVVNLDSVAKRAFEKLLDRSGRIVPEYVLRWMQRVISKAHNNFQNYNYKLSMSASGPAKTLRITTTYEPLTIDVDLVAVFRLELGQWVDRSRDFQDHIVNQVYPSRQRMYLVPKPHPRYRDCMWRKHFPEVEEELLNGTWAAKPVIRILKLLRDRCKWSNVASYYLKTLVMLEVQENGDREYWHDNRTPELVFMMMRKLMDYFQAENLPHLLYRNVNLFEGLNRDELFNHLHRLRRIYRKFMLDIEFIDTFLIPGPSMEAEAFLQAEPSQSWCTVL